MWLDQSGPRSCRVDISYGECIHFLFIVIIRVDRYDVIGCRDIFIVIIRVDRYDVTRFRDVFIVIIKVNSMTSLDIAMSL